MDADQERIQADLDHAEVLAELDAEILAGLDQQLRFDAYADRWDYAHATGRYLADAA